MTWQKLLISLSAGKAETGGRRDHRFYMKIGRAFACVRRHEQPRSLWSAAALGCGGHAGSWRQCYCTGVPKCYTSATQKRNGAATTRLLFACSVLLLSCLLTACFVFFLCRRLCRCPCLHALAEDQR